jgi:TPP-dependent pyruvate/acetoin dehydrogenase alpha subunit
LARQALQKLGSSDQDLRSLEAEISEEIESAIRFAKSSPLPLAEDVMMHVFSKS